MTLLTVSMTCQASRRCRVATTSALYSAAELVISSLSWPSGPSSSASTQRAVPGPDTPDPIRTRRSARITAAASPLASRPICTMEATTP